MVLLTILLTLLWYLFGDRYTPYTQQARVQGFVVGIAPKVSGLITRIWVHNNQEVKPGDRLFQIDRQAYEIALKQAQARLADARTQLAGALSGIEEARARLISAQANEEKARRDAERQARLHRKDPGAISVRRVEVAQATYKEASAMVKARQAALKKAEEHKRGAEKKLAAAQATVDKAALDLEDTLVVAENSGVITDLQADVGRYAKQGQAVMTLVATGQVWIEAQFTENNLGHMRPGTAVEFTLDVLPGRVFAGEVASIGLGVSSGGTPQPGTLPTIQNSRDWLRPAQRFPVVIHFDPQQEGLDAAALRVGGQAEVIAYSGDAGLLLPLGRLFIRFMSWLSYAY
jgi:multidrug resistance efflux pump